MAAAISNQIDIPIGTVVLALPRGGVPVGFEVAVNLNAPLDICIVRRLELADAEGVIGVAVASGHVIVSVSKRANPAKVSDDALTRIVRKESREINRRERAYRGEQREIAIAGRTVILVDDGLAAPETFVAAVAAVRARRAAKLIAGIPVAASSSHRQLLPLVDELVCLELPQPFHGVGASYADFTEVSDLEVRRLHEAARNRLPPALLD